MAIGDFNGDGKADLVVGNFSSGTISILLQNSDGTFAPKVDYAVGEKPEYLAIADFNGDGYADVAVMSYTADIITVLFNNGHSVFGGNTVYPVGSNPHAIAAGDLNGDGKPDLVVANYASNNIGVILNNGDGSFAPEVTYSTPSPVSVVTGDFNGDGKMDLAVANWSSSTVSVLFNTGNGTFGTITGYTVGSIPGSVAVADFNGDGKIDLASTSFNNGTISILMNVGNGTFAAKVDYSPGGSPFFVVAADFNGDGKPDLATSNHYNNSISVLLNNGNGTFGTSTTYDAGTGPQLLATGDINGDGKQDIVVGVAGDNVVRVFLNNSNAMFGTSVTYPIGAYPYSVTTADLNGDGKSDLAVANSNINTVSVLLNNGDGTFATKVDYSVGTKPFSVTTGDFNGDGKADLAIANFGVNGAGTVSVLLNNGDGTFGSAVDYGLGSANTESWSVTTGDFSGDGKLDLAVANYAGGSVSVLLNNGNGTFGPKKDYGGGNFVSVVAGDFNGDGKPDLALANYTGGSVRVLLNAGNGTFLSPDDHSVSLIPFSVTVGDFNGDGKLDLAVTDYSATAGYVSVFLNTGGGTFALPSVYATGFGPISVTTGDFNGDGKLDLATANDDGNSISVLLNNGDGTFASKIDYPAQLPLSITSGDFNGDGRADLAVADSGDNSVRVFLNNIRTQPIPSFPGLPASPGQTVNLLAPSFFWNVAGTASEYGLYISKLQPNGTYALVFDSTTYPVTIPGNANSFQLPTGILVDGGQYRWNMNAKINGVWGPHSSQLYFKVQVTVGTLQTAIDLGTLTAGAAITQSGLIGNGQFAAKGVDLYQFSISQSITVKLDLAAQSAGSTLDGYLRLFDASGKELANNDDRMKGNSDPYLSISLAPGVYYAGVSGYPNRSYSPLIAGSGVSGSVGPYSLTINASAPFTNIGTPKAAGPLSLQGNFTISPSDSSIQTATGTVTINNVLTIQGQVSVDSSLNVTGSGDIWINNVPVLGNVKLYSGNFSFPAGKVITDSFNEYLSGLKVVGLNVSIKNLQIVGDAVRLQGSIVLPSSLGNFKVKISGSDYMQLSLSGGLSFSGVMINVPNVNGMNFFGIPFKTTGLSLHVSASEVQVRGLLLLPKLLGGTTLDLGTDGNHLSITSDGNGNPQVAVVGSASIAGPVSLAPGFALENASLFIDTTTQSAKMAGTLDLPSGGAVSLSTSVVNGTFNAASATLSGIAVPLGTSGLYLQSLGGALDHLSDGQPTLLSGLVGVTYGPQITVHLPSWLGGNKTGSLLSASATGNIDVNHLSIDPASVTLAGGLATGTGKFVLDWSTGQLTANDNLSFLDGLITSKLDLTANSGLDVTTENTANIQIPANAPRWMFPGSTLTSANAYFQFRNDAKNIDWANHPAEWLSAQDWSNDFVAGWTDLPLFGKVGFKIAFDGSISRIGESEVAAFNPPVPSNSTITQLGPTSVSSSYNITGSGAPSLLLSAHWDNAAGNVPVQIQKPDGTVLNEADFDQTTITVLNSLSLSNYKYVAIKNPQPGIWKIIVPDSTGLGTMQFEGLLGQDTPVPQVALTTPTTDTQSGTVPITYSITEADPTTRLALYYDASRSGYNGTQIADYAAGNGSGTFTWDTSLVPDGKYYIYATAVNGNGVASNSRYSIGRITVASPLAPLQITGLEAPDGTNTTAHLSWNASASSTLDHYLVRVASDAAGEYYDQIVAVTDSQAFLSGLTDGKTYRIAVAAVNQDGHIGVDSAAILVVPGGVPSIVLLVGQWMAIAQPGTSYTAQVPGSVGDTYALISGPTDAILNPAGQFSWNMPTNADGWYQILAIVTAADGSVQVWRYSILVDGSNPIFMPGSVQVQATGATTLTISVPAAQDAAGVLRYRLQRNGVPVGSWQTSPTFTDSGLIPNTAYTYQAQAADASAASRLSTLTPPVSGRTLAASPFAPLLVTVGQNTAAFGAIPADLNSTGTQYAIYNATMDSYIGANGTPSIVPVWQATALWTSVIISSLALDTTYTFQLIARNGDGVPTAAGPSTLIHTLRSTVPPHIQSALVNGRTGDVTLAFSESVLLSLKDAVIKTSGGQVVNLPGIAISYNPGDAYARILFNGTLADGSYTLTLKGTGVQDQNGNQLDGAGNGIAGTDYTLPIYKSTRVLAGSPGGDNFYLKKNTDGTYLDIWQNALTPGSGVPSQQILIAGLTGVLVSSVGSVEAVTIDFSNGNPLPAGPGGGINFTGGAGANSLTLIGTAGSDTLTINAGELNFSSTAPMFGDVPITLSNVQSIQFTGDNGGNDSIHLIGGTYTVDANTPTGNPNVSVTVDTGATANFTTDQHLGSLTLNGGVANLSMTRHSMFLNSLSISNNGLLDIANSFVYLNNATTPFATIKNYLDAVYNLYGISNPNAPVAGDYNGAGGITSSIAKTSYANDQVIGVGYYNGALQDPNNPDNVGQLLGPDSNSGHGVGIPLNQILIRPTLTGDLNGDGVVNSYDVGLFNTFGLFNTGPTALGWQAGDLNGDGVVNSKDVTIFNTVGNFNVGAFPPPAAVPNIANSANQTTGALSVIQPSSVKPTASPAVTTAKSNLLISASTLAPGSVQTPPAIQKNNPTIPLPLNATGPSTVVSSFVRAPSILSESDLDSASNLILVKYSKGSIFNSRVYKHASGQKR